MPDVLVTGGLGFIGGHLVKELAEQEHKVTILDSRPGSGEPGRKGGVRTVGGDVRNAADIERAMEGVAMVVHLAAVSDVPSSLKDPMLTNDVNVGGTLNLLRVVAKSKVKRMVFASSAAVYGDGSPPLKEDAPLKPLSPYAASKVAGEAYCAAYERLGGPETVVLRMFNVYGPGGGGEGAVMKAFAASASRGEALKIEGDGSQTRDFVHVKDAVRGILASLGAPLGKERVFNIGSGASTSVNQLAELFTLVAGGRRVAASHLPAREGDVRRSAADISLAQRVLRFRPEVPLREGIREMLASARGGQAR